MNTHPFRGRENSMKPHLNVVVSTLGKEADGISDGIEIPFYRGSSNLNQIVVVALNKLKVTSRKILQVCTHCLCAFVC